MGKNRIQEYIVSYDKSVFITYILLCMMGLLVMLDINSMQSSLGYFYRHLINLSVAFLAANLALHMVKLERIRPLNLLYVIISVLLLIAVLLWGHEVNGAKRQIRIGWFSLQPSFLARAALVFLFAGYLANKESKIRITNAWKFIKEFWFPLSCTLIIFVLIFLEKHLSTLIIGGSTLLGMLIYAGMRWRLVILVILVLTLVLGAVFFFSDPFRIARLQTYLDYNLLTHNRIQVDNSSDDRYHVSESLTALTSGGLIGTGIPYGRAKHNYLPEAQTDYVYTIIGEELGFLGAILVLILHGFIFFRAFKIAEAQTNLYYKYLCAGLAMNIFLNALVNTGVAMSILPSTGTTLPFISYGGTALLVDSLSIGVILNISATRRQL